MNIIQPLQTQVLLILFIVVGFLTNFVQALALIFVYLWNKTLYRKIVQVNTYKKIMKIPPYSPYLLKAHFEFLKSVALRSHRGLKAL